MMTLKELHICSPQKSLSGSKLGSNLRNLLAALKGFEQPLKLYTFFRINVRFLEFLVFI